MINFVTEKLNKALKTVSFLQKNCIIYNKSFNYERMFVVLEIILWIIRFFFGAGIFSFLHIVIDKLTYGKSAICAKSKRIARYFLVELTGGVSMTGCAIVYGCGKMGVISLRCASFFYIFGNTVCDCLG